MTWHTMQEIWDRGFKDVMRRIVSDRMFDRIILHASGLEGF